MNIKSNILLPDSMNRLHNNIVINTDLVEPMFHISNINHFSGSDDISRSIKPNCKSREPLQPFTTATTTAPFMLATSHPRTRPSFTTILKTTHECDSKSPVSVSLARSNSEPNRTNNNFDSVSNTKSCDKGSSNFNCVPNNFSRQNSLPVSNSRVIAFTSAESIMSKSSPQMCSMGNGLTMSGLSIHRMSTSIPSVTAAYQSSPVNRDTSIPSVTAAYQSSPVNRDTSIPSVTAAYQSSPVNRDTSIPSVTAAYQSSPVNRDTSIPSVTAAYQSSPVNRDTNRNTNALEVVCANRNNSSDDSARLLGNKNHKSYDIYKGSLEDDTIINSNECGYITNRKSIKREGKSDYNYISSCTANGESQNSSATSLSCSSIRYPKPNPVISIIPVGVATINITTNGNTVSNKGNEVSLYESCISHKEDPRLIQNIAAQQLRPNSVTITQLQPNSISKAPKSHQPKLIYRASSYEEDDIIVPPVMIVDHQEIYRSGVDSGLYTLEQGTRCGNPVTITPVSYSAPDTCMDDPHPLNLFSTVAANQEYLPTSTATANTTTHDIASYPRSTQPKIMNADMYTLSQHGNHLDIGQLVRTVSNDEFLFSEFMDHSDSQCLSPPPAGMQRRPKVSYKNLSEGEKNVRLRMLNNEASRLYRHRKQHTIKNLQVEEKQLRTVNSKLRVEFEALQLKRDEAMKMLHESLQRCRDCNPSQPVQSGPCPHRTINTPSKSATVDTHTTKLIIKNQILSENM